MQRNWQCFEVVKKYHADHAYIFSYNCKVIAFYLTQYEFLLIFIMIKNNMNRIKCKIIYFAKYVYLFCNDLKP